jgi:serine-type D-Ala-D-Ala carboxypeptidase/endopeptidase (penicillin-binding protein 4)
MVNRWVVVVSISLVLASCVGHRAPVEPPAAQASRRPIATPETAATWTRATATHATPTSTPTRDARRPFVLRAAPWGGPLDTLIGHLPVSVSVAIGGRLRFSHLGSVPRAPASNEKLLLSMALLSRFGPDSRIATTVEAGRPIRHHILHGNAWIVGHGDPELDDGAVERLAEALSRDGVRRIEGSVIGDTSMFRRDRWAPGWHRIALSFISIPTALTFDANADVNGFVFAPERRAAAALTDDLERLGVDVTGAPRAGAAPRPATAVARVRSARLVRILRDQNTNSINLDAEVLGKRLATLTFHAPASIADGARAIRRWAARRGVRVVARDASGLSYANRVTTDGMVRLLSLADRAPWGRALRSTLARPGLGTLRDRLAGIDVRAKTGTLLEGVSALSGWVRRASGGWAVFSILSAGMATDEAVSIEDNVVRFLAVRA